MGNVMTYSGIVTKVRAMQAKLLTDQDYKNIAALPNVPQAIEYLKGKPAYAEYMNRLDSSLYHRSHVEKVLYQSLYDDWAKMFRFAGMEQKKFLKIYWKRYEVDLINYCLRIVFNHYDRPFDLDYKKEFFDRYSQLSIDKLITSTTVEELVDNLKDTEYYEPLNKLKESGNASLFDYDLALDLYYFQALWSKQRRNLKKQELEIFKRDYGTKIDLLNIQWIYRAKKYFSLSPPDIYALLIPIQYKISTGLVKEMVEAPTLEEFQNAVQKTSYARHYDFGQNLTVEKMYADYLYYLYTTDRRRNPYSIASINTYLFMKEEEIKKLTTVIECVRYGVSSDEIMEYTGG